VHGKKEAVDRERETCYRRGPGPDVRLSEAQHCMAACALFISEVLHPIFSFFLYACR
jgi:hypothetical protein